MDILKEAFLDTSMEQYGLTNVVLTQSGLEKRSRLLASRQDLIEEAKKAFQKKTSEFQHDMYVLQPVMTGITAKVVNPDGHITEGSVKWTVQVASPRSKRAIRIDLTFPIRSGKLKSPNTFMTMTGQTYLLNKESIKKVVSTSADRMEPNAVRRSYRAKATWSAKQEI